MALSSTRTVVLLGLRASGGAFTPVSIIISGVSTPKTFTVCCASSMGHTFVFEGEDTLRRLSEVGSSVLNGHTSSVPVVLDGRLSEDFGGGHGGNDEGDKGSDSSHVLVISKSINSNLLNLFEVFTNYPIKFVLK